MSFSLAPTMQNLSVDQPHQIYFLTHAMCMFLKCIAITVKEHILLDTDVVKIPV